MTAWQSSAIIVVARFEPTTDFFDVLSLHRSLAAACDWLAPFHGHAPPIHQSAWGCGWTHDQFTPAFRHATLHPSPECRAHVVIIAAPIGVNLIEYVAPSLRTDLAQLVQLDDLLSEDESDLEIWAV